VLLETRSIFGDRWRDVIIVVHTADPPTDAEWDAMMTAYKPILDAVQPGQMVRALVHTDGGGPNAKQRKRLADDLVGKKVVTAVFTRSLLAQAISTAIRWFNPHSAVFSPKDPDGARRHLSISVEQWPEVMSILERLVALSRSSVPKTGST
jgi:hypothetical protein